MPPPPLAVAAEQRAEGGADDGLEDAAAAGPVADCDANEGGKAGVVHVRITEGRYGYFRGGRDAPRLGGGDRVGATELTES